MTTLTRAVVFRKLNTVLFNALESATLFARHRQHGQVECLHWLVQMLNLNGSDLHQIIAAFHLDPSRLSTDCIAALERLPSHASSFDFSNDIDKIVERAWFVASIQFNAACIRGAHIVLVMLTDPLLSASLHRISQEFRKIDPDILQQQWHKILEASPEAAPEADQNPEKDNTAKEGQPPNALLAGRSNVLKRYTTDLTEQARQGQLDPVCGREDEIRQLVDILIRRRQNNPMLTGEAGVGKTAVVEGLALRIAAGAVPPSLRNARLLALDVGLMQAGASMKGEFESRLKQLIQEVQSAADPVVLFIDEAHTLMGAGGAAGTNDAANLLKPALARGQLRAIAATTWSEYKRHIEKDPALTRRFQVVHIQEPDEARATAMLRSLSPSLQSHHQVVVLNEALEAAVKLSHRYIPARQLPDKAIALLDTACARVALSQTQQPTALEQLQASSTRLEQALQSLRQESGQGHNHTQRIRDLETQLAAATQTMQTLHQQWERERAVVADMQAHSTLLSQENHQENRSQAECEHARSELNRLRKTLEDMQQHNTLVHACVDASAIAAIVSDWTGIPVGRMLGDERSLLTQLPQMLAQRVVGQDHALQAISQQVQITRAGLENPNKPTGVFLLVGPSGVGKTETALALADLLYGGQDHLICINMSEYQEAHTVSTLKGAPPGYVGYGEGGVLTEAVRRRPYSVVLLDEIEKAHPDVHELFYQVFDKGWMEDGEGRYIDFKNTLILLTANVGGEYILSLCDDPALAPEPEVLAKKLHEPLRKVFPAAFLGRVNVVPYYPLADDIFHTLIEHKLQHIAKRLQTRYQKSLIWDPAVLALLRKRCDQIESGGRLIDAQLNQLVLGELSLKLLEGLMPNLPNVRLQAQGETLELVWEA